MTPRIVQIERKRPLPVDREKLFSELQKLNPKITEKDLNLVFLNLYDITGKIREDKLPLNIRLRLGADVLCGAGDYRIVADSYEIGYLLNEGKGEHSCVCVMFGHGPTLKKAVKRGPELRLEERLKWDLIREGTKIVMCLSARPLAFSTEKGVGLAEPTTLEEHCTESHKQDYGCMFYDKFGPLYPLESDEFVEYVKNRVMERYKLKYLPEPIILKPKSPNEGGRQLPENEDRGPDIYQ